MNLSQMMVSAVLKYGFRPAKRGEDFAAYRAELIAFVQRHDWAAAHELRVGRLQADWTKVDVELFEQIIMSFRGTPREEFGPGTGFIVARDDGPYPVTNEGLCDLAVAGLEAVCELRAAHPTDLSTPLYATALLTDGATLTASPDSDDRYAVVKYFVRTAPVFGYFLVCDMFIHTVEVGGPATKKDAICAIIGSRNGLRLIKRRPYHFAGGKVVWDGPMEDIDKVTHKGEDPWANIFAVPQPMRGQPS